VEKTHSHRNALPLSRLKFSAFSVSHDWGESDTLIVTDFDVVLSVERRWKKSFLRISENTPAEKVDW
jgi:hypothetical protein